MTTTQERVRRAIAATADQIAPESVPPLALPRGHALRRWPVWLAPAAAAASVAAIAAAALVISSLVASRPSPGGQGAVSVPPFYIALTGDNHHLGAAIYATRTGALIAKVRPPGGYSPVIGVSAAADDRTFAIAAAVGKPGRTGQPTTRFYLVRFDPVGRAVRVTLIPRIEVPQGTPFRSMSLSPSGTKLAVNINPAVAPGSNLSDVLKIMDLRTGVIQTWTSYAGEMLTGFSASDLSWANDDTTLGFSWYGFTLHPERQLPTSGFWMLDLAKPGRDLLADSHRVLAYGTKNLAWTLPGGYLTLTPQLTADGRTIVTGLTSKPSDTSGDFWFATYDAASGRRERVFDRQSMAKAPLGPNMEVLWTSPGASALVVDPPPGHKGHLGIIWPSGRLTLLPTTHGQTLLPGPSF